MPKEAGMMDIPFHKERLGGIPTTSPTLAVTPPG